MGGKRSNDSGQGSPAKKPRTSRSHTTNGSNSYAEKPKTYGNISLGLITGKIQPIERTVNGFKYVPITKTDADRDMPDLTRVLVVHQGSSDDALECSLRIRLLPKLDARGNPINVEVDGLSHEELERCTVEYIALSYAWQGQDPAKGPIISTRHPKGNIPFRVTENLEDALRALRSSDGDRYFWGDAICMDQDNKKEKSQQLTLMSRIYSEAKEVCVWLGKATPFTPLAFELMDKIRKWKDFEILVERKTSSHEWMALLNLLSAPWFRRRWIVQEIVLARQAELRCGKKHQIGWQEFSQTVSFLEDMKDRIMDKFREDREFKHHPDKIGEISERSACRLVKITNYIVNRDDKGRVERKTESLETLISMLTPFEAKDPADVVYAILSLARDITMTAETVKLDVKVKEAALESIFEGKNLTDAERRRMTQLLDKIGRLLKVDRFPVNYEKSFEEICEDLYTFTTLHSRSLDLICRPWAPVPSEEEDELPSWVRSIEHRPFRLDDDGRPRRHNANSLVALPGESPYKAAGKFWADCVFERDGANEDSHAGDLILSAKGFMFDTVDRIEAESQHGGIPDTWAPYKGQSDNNPVSEEFVRTMVAGKGPKGKDPPLSYSLVAQHIFTSGDGNLVSMTRTLSPDVSSTE